MPSDNFEKSLRQRFQSVEVPPRPAVWEGIQKELAQPKWYQKNRWIWTLAALGLFTLSLSAYWWMSDLAPRSSQQKQEVISQNEKNKTSPQGLQNNDLDLEAEGPSTPTEGLLSQESNNTGSTNPESGIEKKVPGLRQHTSETSHEVGDSSLGDLFPSAPHSSNIADKNRGKEELSIPQAAEKTLTQHLPIAFIAQQGLESLSSEPAINKLPSLTNIDQLTGAQLPGPSKWALGFYVRPELPWYTSASISLEQDPPRTTDLETPRDVNLSDPEFGELVVGQDRPSLVFYEIIYARSGFSAGATLGYYLNPQFSIHTGLGIFASGKHRLSPISGVQTDSLGNSQSLSTEGFSMQNLQLEVPLLAQYTFASDRSSWLIQGGLSMNTSLKEVEFNFDTHENAFRNLSSSRPPLIQKSSHLHAELGLLYRFHLNSHLNLFLGPTQTYGLSPVYQTVQGKNIYLNRLSLRMGIEFR